MVQEYLLEMINISKEFPGVKALDNVTFRVRPGTVHSLMGENGAGKSTLMKCLFGIYLKDSGKIFLNGKEVNFQNTKQALEHGVAMVHQELTQATKRSVMDNLWLGRYPKKARLIVDEKKMYEETIKIFKKLKITIDPRITMNQLSVSERQMIEIAKAVSYNAKVIVLDEPTSSLTDNEIERLFSIIDQLKKQGCGIIYISHKMEEILRISDEVTILRDGKWISTSPAKDLTIHTIIKQMVGRELTQRFPAKTNRSGKTLLKVEHLTKKYPFRIEDVSFELREGEILGVAGLVGSGRTELLETIYGLATKESGELYLEGQKVENRNTAIAIKNGFALVTEDRRETGIFGVRNILDNMTIANLKKYRKYNLYLSDQEMVDDAKRMVKSLSVKTPNLNAQIKNLSGGNQQKVILGRWLLTKAKILLLDEPTRGIDVGAKYEIYELMIDLAKEGKGIIMASSEMPELLGVCDRILVMSNGRLAGIVDAKTATQEQLMELATKFF